MTEARHERAPGDRPSREIQPSAPSEFLVYTIGLFVAVLLTATSFWAANTTLLWPGGVFLGLAVLAIAQMGIHLVFFLHITSGPESTNNVLALAFGVLCFDVFGFHLLYPGLAGVLFRAVRQPQRGRPSCRSLW